MSSNLRLEDGSRVAVIGGGPAGSFFTYFLLQMAERIGLEIQVDLYEPRDFSTPGPQGCNMCGGVISESLVRNLALEGINLPAGVVQRGIDSYFLHMDVGSNRIQAPLDERKVAAVHRGGGPRTFQERKFGSFDGYLLDLAVSLGAQRQRCRVDGFQWQDGRPQVKAQGGAWQTYDLAGVAVGINSPALKLFENAGLAFKPPGTTKTYITEFLLGRETIKRCLGSSIHIFLLNLPRLEFACLIPKGDYVTLCLLGEDIDKPLTQAFLHSPEVQQCMPPNWRPPDDLCHCAPKMNVRSAVRPFGDRIVFVGDCGTTRLYKDGLGAGYRTAKAAARTAVFHGIGERDFAQHYRPTCRSLAIDNAIGKFIFAFTRQIQKRRFARRGVWRMVTQEQLNQGAHRHMSMVLWDVFTGSATYRDILLRTLHPSFLGGFLWHMVGGRRAVIPEALPGRL
ncbi:MAG: NAD(P)/FAD-dependent oxidoreductase [Deltaproteobacteria bacterium]